MKTKTIKKCILTSLLALCASLPNSNLRAQASPDFHAAETPAQRDARMQWWREARFGMFIHWGVYSVPAGYYHDKPVGSIGEWIMNNGKIPMAEYQQFAKEFNPTNFNADAWVKTAKNAGMKYIVITSKHHDGFAMFDTKASPWNIVQASPYGKDPLKDLAAACRKYGVKLGFYYSQAQDWNNGGSAINGKWDKAQEHDMDDYIDKVAVPQVKEICSNYGEFPAVIWWDTPKDMNPNRAQKIYDAVHALRPNIILNNRLGGGFKGDTETPEQKIPAKGFPGRDWETCMTINDTWGYKRDDQHWKSTQTLIRNLCDIASKGGNYLLNVGPDSTGIIPQPEVERLEAVGQWMKVNGEAIYGTSATCFGEELGKAVKAKDGYGSDTMVSSANDWRCTTKAGKIYIIVFNWPANGTFELSAVKGKVTRAFLLAGQKSVEFHQAETGLTLKLPAAAPDKVASVICLQTAN
ncbi:MAG: alpha-L-fucosidase [Verrucomicrobiae bacterium]